MTISLGVLVFGARWTKLTAGQSGGDGASAPTRNLGAGALVLAALRGLLARERTAVVSQLSGRMGSATVLAGISEVRVGRESSAPLVVRTAGGIAQGLVGGGIDLGHTEAVPGDQSLYTAPRNRRPTTGGARTS